MFFFLFGGWRRALADGQGVLLGFRVVVVFNGDNRCPGLAVPAAEVREIHVRGIFHRLHKIVTGRRAAVMTLKIELHPFLEVLFAQQGVDHTDNFSALLIHRQGVEVVHLNDFIRTDRVRHWAGIFRKLQAAHSADVVDAVNRTRAQIGAELLIAEDGQSLFQAQLEPVTAGDAVTGPVMEILVADDAFDIKVVFIGSGVGTCQYVFGVKDVETFILHRAHVEEIDGDDHIDVEVVFEAETFFVPLHGVDERGHRPRCAVKVATVNKQLQRHFTPGASFERIAQHIKITRHQRKEVARFRERILPLHPVTTIFQFALTDAVTVGEQERIKRFIGDDFRREARQDVRAVQVPGDMAETFGFTLGTQSHA